jgi:hypothetical protein
VGSIPSFACAAPFDLMSVDGCVASSSL